LNPRQANGVIKLVVENIQAYGTVDLIRKWIKIKDDHFFRIEAESSQVEFGVFVKNVEANCGQEIKRDRGRKATIIENQVIKVEGTNPEKFKEFVGGVLEKNVYTAMPKILQQA
jgi:hypothetical protein